MMFMTSLRLMTPLHSLSNKRYAHLEEEEEELKKNKGEEQGVHTEHKNEDKTSRTRRQGLHSALIPQEQQQPPPKEYNFFLHRLCWVARHDGHVLGSVITHHLRCTPDTITVITECYHLVV